VAAGREEEAEEAARLELAVVQEVEEPGVYRHK